MAPNENENLLAEEPTEAKEKRPMDEWISFFRDIIIILVVVLFIRSYVAMPFRINGSSMEESYHNDEFIIIDKLSYLSTSAFTLGNPSRGDVVVIKPHANNGKDYYIKRIIGIGGDTVKIENGNVFLKKSGSETFVKLNEGYLSATNKWNTFPGRTSRETEFKVPEGQYFLLGDNRTGSLDARDCFNSCNTGSTTHYIKRDDIVGKLWMTLGAIHVFDTVQTNTGYSLRLAKNIGFSVAPRFLDTPRNWNYTELN